jgi:L-ribulose-5-phosphate 3-epimerase
MEKPKTNLSASLVVLVLLLASVSAAPAASSASALARRQSGQSALARAAAKYSGKSVIKFGVCDWTIGKPGDPYALELAGRLGLEGVQVSLIPEGVHLSLSRPEAQRAYQDAAKSSGVAIASFAIGELNNVPFKSDIRADRWLEEGIGIAKAMGIKIILVPFFGAGELRNDRRGMEEVGLRLRRLAPIAERAGVVLALESYLSADEHLWLLDRVGSPAVKLYYDVANSQEAGWDIFREIRLLGDKIVEFHAKDNTDLYGRNGESVLARGSGSVPGRNGESVLARRSGSVPGKGSMDFAAVRKAMEEIGYSGWLIIEGSKLPLGIEPSIRYDLEHLKRVFARRY